MATRKQKKTVKVRDLKPSKDAKGGGGPHLSVNPKLSTSPKLSASPNVQHS